VSTSVRALAKAPQRDSLRGKLTACLLKFLDRPELVALGDTLRAPLPRRYPERR
jgi:hypothetical protein